MLSQKVESTIQLSVVASLVDGQASEEEISTLVAKVAKLYGEDAEEIRSFALGKVEAYRPQDFGNKRVRALKAAVEALHNLNNKEDYDALAIATAVVQIGGVTSAEGSFISQLSNIVGPVGEIK